MTTRCLSQFTHVYSIKEIHHIDDDGIGGVYSKVGFISVFICKCCTYDWLEGAKKHTNFFFAQFEIFTLCFPGKHFQSALCAAL